MSRPSSPTAGAGSSRCWAISQQTYESPTNLTVQKLGTFTDTVPQLVLPDWVTARGMRTLGAPEKGDPRVISGESGAVTTGLVETLMLDPEYAELKELIGLDKTSSVLCFSTEGDTDPDQYRRIVWEGEYPTC